jgi:hypothetical protein
MNSSSAISRFKRLRAAQLSTCASARLDSMSAPRSSFQWPDLVAGLLFTPLLATWSIWVGIGVSSRSSDVPVAQQIGLLVSLPPVFVAVLSALNVIPPTLGLAIIFAVALVVLDCSAGGSPRGCSTRAPDRRPEVARSDRPDGQVQGGVTTIAGA